jgi:hypothetical protein
MPSPSTTLPGVKGPHGRGPFPLAEYLPPSWGQTARTPTQALCKLKPPVLLAEHGGFAIRPSAVLLAGDEGPQDAGRESEATKDTPTRGRRPAGRRPRDGRGHPLQGGVAITPGQRQADAADPLEIFGGTPEPLSSPPS